METLTFETTFTGPSSVQSIILASLPLWAYCTPKIMKISAMPLDVLRTLEFTYQGCFVRLSNTQMSRSFLD